MSKFNFLAGGYYGKLGQTVGQRWKNKRTLRTYVIPADPRTPAQVLNRSRFANATKASQLAMQLNKGANIWQTADNTEFNNRVSSARQYFTSDMVLYQYVPAIPYGYHAPYELSTIVQKSGQVLTFSCATLDDISGRSMVVLYQAVNLSTGNTEDLIGHGVFEGSTGEWLFTVTVPSTHEVNRLSWCIAVSDDDNLFSDKTIYLAPQLLLQPKAVVNVTVSQRDVVHNSSVGIIVNCVFAESLQEVASVGNVACTGTYQLQGIETSFSGNYETNLETTRLQIALGSVSDSLGQQARFSTSSVLSVPEVTVETDNFVYVIGATSGAVTSDSRRNTAYRLVYAVTSQSYTSTRLRFVTDVNVQWSQVSNGQVSFPYYAEGADTESVATGIAMSWSQDLHAITIVMDSQTRHYTGTRNLTITRALGLLKDGCIYQIPTSDVLVDSAPDTSHYTVTEVVTLKQFMKITENTYNFAFNMGANHSAVPSFTGQFVSRCVLQGEFVETSFTPSITVLSAGGYSVDVQPPVDSLGQRGQFPSGSSITVPALSITVGMTDFSSVATSVAVSADTDVQSVEWTYSGSGAYGRVASGYINKAFSGLNGVSQSGEVAIPMGVDDTDYIVFTITFGQASNGQTPFTITTNADYLPGKQEDGELSNYIQFTQNGVTYQNNQRIPYSVFPYVDDAPIVIDMLEPKEVSAYDLGSNRTKIYIPFDFGNALTGSVTESEFDSNGGYVQSYNGVEINVASTAWVNHGGNLCLELTLESAYPVETNMTAYFYLDDSIMAIGSFRTSSGLYYDIQDCEAIDLMDGNSHRIVAV